MLNFAVNNEDFDTISAIAQRALAMARVLPRRPRHTLQDWRMDITAVHASGNPLRLADLLAADDFNFAHDVFGIYRYLDRSTGELRDFFSPRFSARVHA